MKSQLHRVGWKLRQIFLAYVVGSAKSLAPLGLANAKNVLLVTAHPDDECLFFAPSLLGIFDAYPTIKGGLLVLSTGNNYGMGEVRNEELKGSCQALGIDPSRCLTNNHPDLQDNPTKWWPSKTIQQVVKEHVRKWEIDAIVTFDDGGVSGHINHRAVSDAMRSFAKDDGTAPPVFELVTTSLIRKYTFLWDLPLTTLLFVLRNGVTKGTLPGAQAATGAEGLMVNTWAQYVATRAAFASHWSQYTWDRNIYMVLSRYVWFNTLRRVG